jgi:hypothetical protein
MIWFFFPQLVSLLVRYSHGLIQKGKDPVEDFYPVFRK